MKKSRSFGLIEVLLTAGIFIIFAGALITLTSTSTRNITINKHRLQATNLAREGAELVREIRDTAWRNNVAWVDMPGACWGLAPGVGVDRRLDPNLYQAAGCPFFHHRLIPTPPPEIITQDNVEYTRIINIHHLTIVSTDDTKRVTVTVSWQDFGQDKNVRMITYLTNWR